MKIGFVITARLKSTRLPKKLLLPLGNSTVIGQMIKRLKESKALDTIIIATSTNPQDKPLEQIAKDMNIKCFKGSEDDVVERLYEACVSENLDYMINVTADCPLVAFDYIEKIVNLYKKTNADLITSFELPHGFFMYGIKPKALKKVIEIKDQNDTEVWGKYFMETGLFKIKTLKIPKEHQRKVRLTIDYPEDYKFFKKIYEHFGEKTYKISTGELIKFFDENPKITEINKDCDEKYKKRWEEQSNKMKLK